MTRSRQLKEPRYRSGGAVLVGIGEYTDASYCSLPRAREDAIGMYAMLTHTGHGAFDPRFVKLLVDGSRVELATVARKIAKQQRDFSLVHKKFPETIEGLTRQPDQGAINPSRENIGETIRVTANAIPPGGTLVIHFSGHGEIYDADLALVPLAATAGNGTSMIQFGHDLLDDYVAGFRGACCVVILDACHSEAAKLALRLAAKGEEQRPWLHVLASCRAHQQAMESRDAIYSFFSARLIQGLSGAASPPGADGTVTLADLVTYLQANVPEVVFKAGARAGQEPAYHGVDPEAVVLCGSLPPNSAREAYSIGPERRDLYGAGTQGRSQGYSESRPTTHTDLRPLVPLVQFDASQPPPVIVWNEGADGTDPPSEFYEMVYIPQRGNLLPFYVDRYPVTVARHKRWKSAGVWRYESWTGDDYPMTALRVSEMEKYVAWAGKQLPSAAQWEAALCYDPAAALVGDPFSGPDWDHIIQNGTFGQHQGLPTTAHQPQTAANLHDLMGNAQEVVKEPSGTYFAYGGCHTHNPGDIGTAGEKGQIWSVPMTSTQGHISTGFRCAAPFTGVAAAVQQGKVFVWGYMEDSGQ